MPTPYDVSTVVSRSYIPEQMQDSMQKGQEQKNAAFLAEFQKEYEKKQKEVGGKIKTESAGSEDHYNSGRLQGSADLSALRVAGRR